MKILVLGASGGCGQWVVKLAYQRGHDITAVVRPNSSYIAPAGAASSPAWWSSTGCGKQEFTAQLIE